MYANSERETAFNVDTATARYGSTIETECQADGAFSVVTCLPSGSASTQVANSDQSAAASISGTTGTVVGMTCIAGYCGDRNAVCQLSGQFPAVTCTPDPCTLTKNLDKSDVGVVTDDTAVTAVCDAAYGSTVEMECQADGECTALHSPSDCVSTQVTNSAKSAAEVNEGHGTANCINDALAARIQSDKTGADIWECPKCTYHNDAKTDPLCAMCGESFTVMCTALEVANSDDLWTCPRCTLRNPQATLHCEACEGGKPAALDRQRRQPAASSQPRQQASRKRPLSSRPSSSQSHKKGPGRCMKDSKEGAIKDSKDCTGRESSTLINAIDLPLVASGSRSDRAGNVISLCKSQLLCAGEKVDVYWHGERRFFAGRVQGLEKDGVLVISYEDGDLGCAQFNQESGRLEDVYMMICPHCRQCKSLGSEPGSWQKAFPRHERQCAEKHGVRSICCPLVKRLRSERAKPTDFRTKTNQHNAKKPAESHPPADHMMEDVSQAKEHVSSPVSADPRGKEQPEEKNSVKFEVPLDQSEDDASDCQGSSSDSDDDSRSSSLPVQPHAATKTACSTRPGRRQQVSFDCSGLYVDFSCGRRYTLM